MSLDSGNRLRHAAFQVGDDGDAEHRRPIRHGAGGHLDHARGDGDRHANPKTLRHRHDGRVRLLPALPGRGGGPRGHAGLLHHAGGGRDRRSHPDRAAKAAAQGGDGALHLRPPAGLPDLLGQWRLRIAGHGGRGRLARRALRPERRAASQSRHRRLEPVFHLRSVEMHRLLALRPRLRGRAGHLCADHRRPRFRLGGVGGDAGDVSSARNASPAAPACRPARPRR